MTDKKIKILTLGDHPLATSGVGIQTRLFIEGLLNTGRYEFVTLAGAHTHEDYTPMQTEQYGEDWKIFPIKGYGTVEMARSILRTERPDVVWMMTDPRYWSWLWQIEDEIRPLAPMVYYHVWDNYPTPYFNEKFYRSNDVVVSISKVTENIVNEVAPDLKHVRIHHTVDETTFKPLDPEEVAKFRSEHIGDDERVLFFWNNRNHRRKQPTTLLWWFKEFAEEVGKENVALLFHTDPKEPVGSDIEQNLARLDMENGEVMISPLKYSEDKMAMLYNMVDCTINISDAEGFGLSTLESLFCGTPIIVNNTGGLQEQVTDGQTEFGVGIDPKVKNVIGSQLVPYIYEDKIAKEDFIAAMKKIYNMTKEERAAIGESGRQYVLGNYSQAKAIEAWDSLITELYQTAGSWETRTGHKNWKLIEIGAAA
tara:strand:- start:2690 stop:3958 length:1269 start_codon:yes stop_codon:yes gene_type:complete